VFFWTINTILNRTMLRNPNESQFLSTVLFLVFNNSLPLLLSIILIAFNSPLTAQLEPIVQSYLAYSILSAGPLLLFFVRANDFTALPATTKEESVDDASSASTAGTPKTARSSSSSTRGQLVASMRNLMAQGSQQPQQYDFDNLNLVASSSFLNDTPAIISAMFHGLFVVCTGSSIFLVFVLLVPYMFSKNTPIQQVDQALMIALAGGVCGIIPVSLVANFKNPDPQPGGRAGQTKQPTPRARKLHGLRFLMFFFSCVQWACFIGWITIDARGFEYEAMCAIGFFLGMSGIGIFVGSSILSDIGFVYNATDAVTESIANAYHSGCAAVGSALLLLLIRLNTSSGLLNYTALSQTTAALSGVGSVCALLSWAAFKPFKK